MPVMSTFIFPNYFATNTTRWLSIILGGKMLRSFRAQKSKRALFFQQRVPTARIFESFVRIRKKHQAEWIDTPQVVRYSPVSYTVSICIYHWFYFNKQIILMFVGILTQQSLFIGLGNYQCSMWKTHCIQPDLSLVGAVGSVISCWKWSHLS